MVKWIMMHTNPVLGTNSGEYLRPLKPYQYVGVAGDAMLKHRSPSGKLVISALMFLGEQGNLSPEFLWGNLARHQSRPNVHLPSTLRKKR